MICAFSEAHDAGTSTRHDGSDVTVRINKFAYRTGYRTGKVMVAAYVISAIVGFIHFCDDGWGTLASVGMAFLIFCLSAMAAAFVFAAYCQIFLWLVPRRAGDRIGMRVWYRKDGKGQAFPFTAPRGRLRPR